MKSLCKILQLLLLLNFSPSLAEERAILISQKLSQTPTFAFTKNLYDDIRVIGNKSKWFLKNKNVQISLEYSNQTLSAINIKRIQGSEVVEVIYAAKSSQKLRLVSFQKRPLESYNYTIFDKEPEKSSCTLQEQATTKLTEIKDKLNSESIESNLNNFILDKSCGFLNKKTSPESDNSLNENSATQNHSSEYESFVGEIVNASSIVNRNGYKNSFSNCLEKPGAVERFSKVFPDTKENLDILAAKYKLELAKMYEGSPQVKPMIRCEAVDKQSSTAKCAENGQITFYLPKYKIDDKNIQRQFIHEMTHRVGVKSEKLVDSLIAYCFDGKDPEPTYREGQSYNPFEVVKTTPNPQIAQTTSGAPTIAASTASAPATEVTKAAESVATSTAQMTRAPAAVTAPTSVPREISTEQLGAPSLAEFSQPVMTANANTAEGVQRAETQSYSQSNSVFNFANLVTGASQPANAGSTNTLAANREVSGSSNSYASNSNGLRPGERVVEEINASDRRVAAASQTRAAASSIAAPNNSIEAPKAIIAPQAGLPDDVAAAAGIRPAPRGSTTPTSTTAPNTLSSDSLASNGPTDPQTINAAANRNSNNRSPSSIATFRPAPSREELTTFILSSEYRTARQRLYDPKIQEGLRTAGITVIDLKGTRFGATKGTIIILDQGDRFVRQK